MNLTERAIRRVANDSLGVFDETLIRMCNDYLDSDSKVEKKVIRGFIEDYYSLNWILCMDMKIKGMVDEEAMFYGDD